MKNRRDFSEVLADFGTTHLDRSIAFLWYYRQSQEFEERTASELASDLHDEGFSKPNVSRLHHSLVDSRYVIRATRIKSFRLNLRYLSELDEIYSPLLGIPKVKIDDTVIPFEWVDGTRLYLESLVRQINGSYQFGFYDCTAVLCRRLMESLIIEVYISTNRHQHIQNQGVFVSLKKLISLISSDQHVVLSRKSPTYMTEIKNLGDTASHDRVYITHQSDVDDSKQNIRRLICELLALSGIRV